MSNPAFSFVKSSQAHEHHVSPESNVFTPGIYDVAVLPVNPTITPQLMKIDSHQHFWKFNTKDYEELLKSYFDTVLEAIGLERLIFGSDWTVCLMRSSHTQWLETVRFMISPLTDTEQAAIMGETARRVYQLTDQP